jgi:hypothetical protein
MLHKGYYCKGSVAKNKKEEELSGHESQGAWRQNERFGSKPAVMK